VSPSIEYFFDYSCPYAYLGSTQIESIASRAGAALVWRPMLLGGVFGALGTPQDLAGSLTPAKARHTAADLMRWAGVWGVPLKMPAGHPRRTVDALRATLAAPEERRPALIHRIFRAYWVDGDDVARREVLEGALADVGLGRELAGPFDDAAKDALRASTDEAIARGVFGAPTAFAGGEPYYGQDRLWMLARHLGVPEAQGPDAHVPKGGELPEEATLSRGDELTFWYDFSSPFTYFASTQVAGMSARAGVPVRWRPFLLGGLFRAIGAPDAPMTRFPAAKQRYGLRDLQRWAAYWELPFRWPSRFPMRTLLPLRVVLALGDGDEGVAFVARTFRAYWAEDRDISAEAVVRELLAEVGADPDVVERTRDPAIKAQLIANTEAAERAGLFGAPAFTVGDRVFWGQDRLGFVERLMVRRGGEPTA